MNDLKKEKDGEDMASAVPTVEEMRLKRLAFFGQDNQIQSQTKEWKIEHPPNIKLPLKETIVVEGESIGSMNAVNENKEKHKADINNVNHKQDAISHNYYPVSENQNAFDDHPMMNSKQVNMQFHPSFPEHPRYSSQIPGRSTRRNSDFSETGPVPLKAKRSPSTGISRSSALSSSMGHLSLTESKDSQSQGLSVFRSRPDLDDLGLSTHRPNSEVSARSIQGELYIPSNQGSCKTTKQIFSHKTQEELYSALGNEKMEELMNKVTHDIGEFKQGRSHAYNPAEYQVHPNVSSSNHAKGSNVLDDKQNIFNNRTGSFEHLSPRRQSLNQDATKDYHSLLAQNHDQITLPKSARNSFSSEEIYRQAYGDGMMQERNYNSRGFSTSNAPWSLRQPDKTNEQQPVPENEGHYSLNSARSSLVDYPGQMPIRHSQHPGYPHPFSYPPPAIPPQPFDLHQHPYHHPPHSTAVPISPQSSYSGSGLPFYMQHPPPYTGHNNQAHPLQHPPQDFFHNLSHGSPQYNQLYGMAQGTPPSSGINSMYSYNNSFSSPHYGPRVLGHPGISSTNSAQHPYHQHSQSPYGLNQNNLDYNSSHSSSGMKVPHPPSIPPALQGKEESQTSKPKAPEHRSSLSNLPQHKNGEKPSSARASVNQENAPDKMGRANQNNNNNKSAVRQRPSSADYERRKPVYSQNRNTRPSSAQVRNEKTSGAGSQQNHTSHVPPPKRNNYLSSTSGQSKREKSPVIIQKNGNKDTTSQALSSQSSLSQSQQEHQTNDNDKNNTVDRKKEDEALHDLCPEFHRLPPDHEEETADKMHAVAKSGYDRFHELTPRLHDGDLSLWQCLPDEVWLFILTFLPQSDLCHLMMVSKGFYRLANDESLWRYITVRPHFGLTDSTFASIMSHHPISLAMVKCQGYNLSTNALKDFFSQTQGRLKELNICGCSHGSLVGSVVLETASKFCHSLTHLDASFCNINDASFTAIVSCCDRLESVCINGFQSMSDSTLLTLVKKHGTSLRTLELYACFSLTASVLRNLGEYCHNLRRLCLGGCNKLTASTMITLSTNLSRVEELDLRGCRNLKNECIRKIVRNCPRIQTLVLANCQQISNPALVEMGTYLKTTLRVVDVCGCNLVGDEGVISLVKNCDRLTSLDISSTGCMHSSMSAIASSGCSRWMETVKLSFLSGISEANLINLLRHCPKLKLIHAFGCSSLRNLTRLRDMRPGVTIEGDVEAPRMSFQ